LIKNTDPRKYTKQHEKFGDISLARLMPAKYQ